MHPQVVVFETCRPIGKIFFKKVCAGKKQLNATIGFNTKTKNERNFLMEQIKKLLMKKISFYS